MIRKKISSGKRTLLQRSKKTTLQTLVACGCLLGAGMMQSCDKDLLTGQPEWLGNSIYERLQDGIDVNDGTHKSFNYTIRLIDDLGYTNVLSKTGSKTLFATPDDAYDAWFAQKGIKYENLSTNMKKYLLNNAMINNAYLLELMSNVAGTPPETGACMRRESSATYMDSIPTWKVADMPTNPMGETVAEDERTMDAWRTVRKRGKDIHVFKDNNNATMIHFLPAFMQNKSITDEDLQVVSNGQSSSIQDSWINGRKVISSEQTCKNGYIYVVDSVMDFKSNMAQVIHELPNTKLWAQALDRFSCPVPVTGSALRTYQEAMNANDTVYTIRYFNNAGNHELRKGGAIEDNLNADNLLRFDPGWNGYYTNGQSASEEYRDAAVMIVPTDDEVERWLTSGEGKDLFDHFGSWENIDISNMQTLLSVNMLESFVSSVPSKFDYVLDKTSQQQLGITKGNIIKCYMCCNGIIYLVNNVFTPDEYSTVIFPAKLQISDKYTVMGHALYGNYSSYAKDYDFSPYLGALDSKFELFIPYSIQNSENSTLSTKNYKVFRMIDPCTFGLSEQNIIEFYYANNKINAMAYKGSDTSGGYVVDYSSGTALSETVIKNRLYDLIDNSVIVDNPITSDQTYYLTKAGSIVYAKKEGSEMIVKGGYQMEQGQQIAVTSDNVTHKSNGNTYSLCTEETPQSDEYGVIMTAQKSVYEILQEQKNDGKSCSKFFDLLTNTNCGLLSSEEGNYKCAGADGTNFNVNIFDSYNYTVYVPTDDAIDALGNYLPTWEDYEHYDSIANGELPNTEGIDAETTAANIKSRLVGFLRYHIQDNAIMVGGKQTSSDYETGKLDSSTGRFFSLSVSNSNSGITITDAKKKVHHVLTGSNYFHNKVAREYWIAGKGTSSALISSSSNAAVHMIDGTLSYEDTSSDWHNLIVRASSSKRARFAK